MRRACVIVIATAALGAASCGASASAGTVLVSAGTRTQAVGTFKFLGQDLQYVTDHASVRATGTSEGSVDLVQHLLQVSYNGSGGLPGDSGPQQTQTIIIGVDMWTTGLTPPGSVVLGPGGTPVPEKPWMHIRRPTGEPAVVPGGLDPTTLLDKLKARGNVHRVGQGTVEGVATTEYAEAFPAPTGQAAQDYGAGSLDVWVDHDGLVRQVRVTQALKAAPDNDPPTPAETDVATIQYYDFGAAVTVAPPPASQTEEFGQGLNTLQPCVSSASTALLCKPGTTTSTR